MTKNKNNSMTQLVNLTQKYLGQVISGSENYLASYVYYITIYATNTFLII